MSRLFSRFVLPRSAKAFFSGICAAGLTLAVGPVAGDRDHAVGRATELADVLLGREHDPSTSLAISRLVDDEDAMKGHPPDELAALLERVAPSDLCQPRLDHLATRRSLADLATATGF